MSQQISAIDLAAIHNAMSQLTSAYGQMLAEQERRMSMLASQLKLATDENAKLKEALAERGRESGR